ncbi:MAG: hypothetical protein ABH879_06125 [archaeon]
MRIARIRISQKTLSDVPEDRVFWLNDGRVLRNIRDLSSALADMGPGVFQHHVNCERNDFVNWIRDVVCDKTLVKAINGIGTPEQLRTKLDNRISRLESLSQKRR